MQVVEVKESGESFVSKTISRIDFLSYQPLASFVNAELGITLCGPFVKTIQRSYRRHLLLKQKDKMLFKFYSKDMEALVSMLEHGIEVLCFDSRFRKTSTSSQFSSSSVNKYVTPETSSSSDTRASTPGTASSQAIHTLHTILYDWKLTRGFIFIVYTPYLHNTYSVSSSQGFDTERSQSVCCPPGMVPRVLWVEPHDRFFGQSRVCVASRLE